MQLFSHPFNRRRHALRTARRWALPALAFSLASWLGLRVLRRN